MTICGTTYQDNHAKHLLLCVLFMQQGHFKRECMLNAIFRFTLCFHTAFLHIFFFQRNEMEMARWKSFAYAKLYSRFQFDWHSIISRYVNHRRIVCEIQCLNFSTKNEVNICSCVLLTVSKSWTHWTIPFQSTSAIHWPMILQTLEMKLNEMEKTRILKTKMLSLLHSCAF